MLCSDLISVIQDIISPYFFIWQFQCKYITIVLQQLFKQNIGGYMIVCRRGKKPVGYHLSLKSRKIIDAIADEYGVSKTVAVEIIAQKYGAERNAKDAK